MSTLTVTPAHAQACDPTRQSCGPAQPPPCQRFGTCPTNPPGGGGTCTAPPGGDPAACGGSGPAALPRDSGPSAGAGNPINLLNGNKYQEETDLAPLPGVLGLELKRYYNSQSSHPGMLGSNWRMSYETVLYDFGSQIQIVQADGRRLMFQRGVGANATLCSSSAPQDGQVRIELPKDGKGQPTYFWRWADGRTLMFASGSGGGFPLQSITAATGERVTLSYSPAGELTSIRDPQGRTLSFIYANAAERRSRALKAIDTPLGRLAYTQDASGRLTEVSQAKDASGPPDRTRIYHYEDRYNAGFKQALTGISLRGPDPQTKQPTEQRLSTYAYDATGLAVLSTKGSPLVLKDGKPVADTGIDQVQVAYVDKALPRPVKVDAATGEVTPSQRGQVVLTNSLGQRTQVWSAVIAGHFRLMEMRGAGCSTCGPANMRYGYDAQGALVRSTGLDAQGQPLRSEVVQHDAFGRVTRTGIQTYDGAKPQPVRWMQRFEYADVRFKDGSVAIAPQPSLIARPSVVAGKEHTITFDYNAAGQLTQVTEAGFSPVDANGATAAQGAPISRSTRLAYQVVNGRSVLASVDGPLPNGPKGSPEDSDIVRLSWDNTGTNVVAVVYPMNLTASLEFDEVTGAALKITGPSGYTDSYRYGTDRELLTSTRSRGDQVFGGASYRYDLRGRLLETSSLIGGKPRPETLQAFDVAGRLLWQADRLGVVRKATYDTEGHLVRSQVVGGGIQQEERYAYDASGRVDRVDDNTGATRRLVRDANGRITATIDPLGRATEYAPRPNERSLEVTQAANTSKPLTVRYGIDAAGGVNEIGATASDGGNGKRTVVTRLLKDDFGHEVGIVSPDSGTVFKRYDAADQLIQVRDATGTVVDMAYDAAGRLTARSVTPAAAAGRPPAEAQTTRYRYQGTLLVEIQNPQQTEHYTYDERARVTSRAVRMTLASGQVSSSEERYRYDADGRLVARSLPDGGELQYERNGQGQVVAMSRQTSAWAPFGWGRTTLVSGIEADLIGLRSATYGNGVVAQWQRSREGVLARVVYTSPLRTQSAVRTAFESLMSQAHAQAAAVAQAESAGKPPTPQQLPGAFGLARAPQALWDGRLLYDMAGNVLVQSQFADTAAASPTQTSYTYDGLNQLAQAVRASTTEIDARAVADRAPQSPSGTAWRYHNDSLGNRLLAQQEEPAAEMGRTTKLSYAEPASDRLDEMAMDAAGRPSADGERRYAWDAEGRLAAVSQPGKPTAHYRYDARGLRVSKQIGDDSTHYLYDERRQRVAELDAQGRVQREYVWMGTQLLAVLDLDTPRTAGAAPSDMLGRIAQLAANTWRAWTGHADTLAYVHANHLGAPVAMTDADAKPVWAVEYAPFGQRMSPAAPTLIKVSAPGHAAVAGIEGMRLDLRLPGQWEDAETGLYYNDHRYYDPRAGRYLNPDPSGLNGGLNAYAYVGNNPLGFADPLGLVLFAFDGTGNDESNPSTVSNVVKFKNNYTDGPVYYITGPGTLDPATGIQGGLLDAASSLTGKARITAMINYLNTYSNSVADDTPFNIDIVGFSRGAAEARDFANQVAALFSNGYYRYKDSNGTVKCQKIALNFMGLWDTVLSVHTGSYQLGIPAGFHYVAQATALNEYRPLFPSESILGAATPTGTTRIELGFLGSHADIGGGFGDGDGALSNVSLAWMFQQAKLAMVNVNPPSLSLIANPVIHDKSSNLLNGAPNGGPTPTSQDRDVRYANGTVVKQRQTTDQGMTYNDTTQFINYKSDPNSIDNISGTVNAAKYVEWLTSHGYDLGNLTVH